MLEREKVSSTLLLIDKC